MNHTKIAEVCGPIADYFERVPESDVEMGQGFYEPSAEPGVNRPAYGCCVGAHLAYFLQAEPQPGTEVGLDTEALGWNYDDGLAAFCDALGATEAQVTAMLQHAGAGVRMPFGSLRWLNPPAEVFRRLCAIEELPDV